MLPDRRGEGLGPENSSVAPLLTPSLWPLSSPLALNSSVENEPPGSHLKCKFGALPDADLE